MKAKKFKVGDIVKWDKLSKDHSVYYAALAKVVSIEGDHTMEIEWLKNYPNIELVNGQMDGTYFQDDFVFIG
jgi:hypothetical protein